MMKDEKMQKAFRYLFERLNEPLGMGVKGGSDQDMVYYEMPKSMASFLFIPTFNLITYTH